MTPRELRDRLRKLDRRLDLIFYNRTEDKRIHANMCSVTWKGHHLCSMSNNFIPKFQVESYRPPGAMKPYRSVFGLAQSLLKSNLIGRKQAREILK